MASASHRGVASRPSRHLLSTSDRWKKRDFVTIGNPRVAARHGLIDCGTQRLVSREFLRPRAAARYERVPQSGEVMYVARQRELLGASAQRFSQPSKIKHCDHRISLHPQSRVEKLEPLRPRRNAKESNKTGIMIKDSGFKSNHPGAGIHDQSSQGSISIFCFPLRPFAYPSRGVLK